MLDGLFFVDLTWADGARESLQELPEQPFSSLRRCEGCLATSHVAERALQTWVRNGRLDDGDDGRLRLSVVMVVVVGGSKGEHGEEDEEHRPDTDDRNHQLT